MYCQVKGARIQYLQDPASRRVVDCRYPANRSRWSRFKWNSSLQARTCCSPNPWWFPASTLIFWILEWKSIQRDRHWSNWIHSLCRVGLGFTFVNLVQGEAVQNRLPAVGSLLLTQPFHLYPFVILLDAFSVHGQVSIAVVWVLLVMNIVLVMHIWSPRGNPGSKQFFSISNRALSSKPLVLLHQPVKLWNVCEAAFSSDKRHHWTCGWIAESSKFWNSEVVHACQVAQPSCIKACSWLPRTSGLIALSASFYFVAKKKNTWLENPGKIRWLRKAAIDMDWHWFSEIVTNMR